MSTAKAFEENLEFEATLARISAGREKAGELSTSLRRRLTDYVEQKRAWNRSQHAAMEKYEAESLREQGPRVAVLRHAQMKIEEFPLGTPVRDSFERARSLQESSEPLLAEAAETRRLLGSAKSTLEKYETGEALSADGYAQAAASVTYYRHKLKIITPKALNAQQACDAARSAHLASYADYVSLVNQLNKIGRLDRPLKASDVQKRAAEVGEVARLEFLLSRMVTPQTEALKKAA